MKYDVLFFAQSALLGLGLATDAFSVSLANGLHESDMKRAKRASWRAFLQVKNSDLNSAALRECKVRLKILRI